MTSIDRRLAPPFVGSDFGALQAALLVRATDALARERPLHGEPSPIADRAIEQQRVLVGRLETLGVRTILLDGDATAPLGAFAADTAVVFRDGAFLMRPSDLSRRAEIAATEAALTQAAVPIVGRIEAPGLLDGGDVMLSAQTLYIGLAARKGGDATGIPTALRGNALGRAQLAAYARSIGLNVVEVAVTSEVPRLRAVCSLVDARTAVVAAGSVDMAALGDLGLVEVPYGEALGAGLLALGERRVVANLRFRESIPLLRRAKIVVEALDLWEFGKVGATPASLVLALKRA